MSVKVDTGPVSAEECLVNVPREQWRDLVEARGYFCRVKLPYDCRMLLRFVEEAQEMYAELGFESVEDLIRRGLELEPDVAEWATQGLALLKR